MLRVSLLPVVVAAFAAFVFSFLWYSGFGQQMAKLHPAYVDGAAQPPAWKMLAELLRNLVLAFVLARLAVMAGVAEWTSAVALALLIWVGFPLVLWSGAVLWEKVPPLLAAIHAGDWLAKLVLIAVVVGVWRR
jgi:hypothetical protein